MHSIGYIHCDLKPDNICLADGKNGEEMADIKLIDFGICKSICRNRFLFKEPVDDDEHINYGELRQKGNLIFASPNSVLNMQVSRRDDMISLFYLILHLQTKKLPFFKSGTSI